MSDWRTATESVTFGWTANSRKSLGGSKFPFLWNTPALLRSTSFPFLKNHRWVSMNLWLGACFDIHCELWGVRYTDVGLWKLSAIYSICPRRTLVLSLSNKMSYYYTDAAIKIHLDMKSFTQIRVWGFYCVLNLLCSVLYELINTSITMLLQGKRTNCITFY